MGAVYLALDTELNRRVAFKMIRTAAGEADAGPLEATPTPGDASYGELKARFLQEAWVTGGLEHPGIVPVYELGRTTGGVPYYTMRLVRGERTLADAIEAAKGLDERLALLEPFLKVCDTIRYAHARGVIHRDLKPSNIALGNFGETVVLDWGLAKLKDRPDHARSVWQERIEDLRDETDLQTLASALGTPGYMSPEAALVKVEEVDARSDVYSLGAILYRILTGKLPYEFQSYPELVEKLTTQAPQPPSEVDAAVPTGLSAICMKALSASRERRYGDADELAAVIRAWQRESAVDREVATLLREAESALESAPELGGDALLRSVDRVTAVCARILELRPAQEEAQRLQQEGRRQRERAIAEREQAARKKLLKRVAVVSLITATAATIVVALLLDARRREAEEARQAEAAARQHAEDERTRAEDLAGFMLFDLRDGLKPIGRLDLLGKVALKSKDYYESLPNEGLTDRTLRRRATALIRVGSVLKAQGDLERAGESYRAAVVILQRLVAKDPAGSPWLDDLAIGQEMIADVQREAGALEDALGTYGVSLAIWRLLVERDPKGARCRGGLALTLEKIGDVRFEMGQLDEALASYARSLESTRRLAEQEPESADRQNSLAISLLRLGDVQGQAGQWDAALGNYRQSLEILRRLSRRDPTNVRWQRDLSIGLSKVGAVAEERGNLAAALRGHKESLAIMRNLAERDPTNATRQRDLTVGLNQVAAVLSKMGSLEAALGAYQEALAIRRRLCEQDPGNARWLRDLYVGVAQVGDTQRAMEDPEAALRSYHEALAIARRLVGQAPSIAECQRDLAITLGKIGQAYEELGDLKSALRSSKEALATSRRLLERDPRVALWQSDVWVGLNIVADLLQKTSDLEGALRTHREALALARRLSEQAALSAAWEREISVSINEVAEVLEAQGELDQALENYRESLRLARKLVERNPSNDRWQRGLSVKLQNVGDVHRAQGNLKEAVRSYREAAAIRKGLAEKRPSNAARQRDLAHSLRRVGTTLEAQGKFKEAVRVLLEARNAHRRAVESAPRLAKEHGRWVTRHRRAALLAGESEPEGPEDDLLLAGAFYDRGDFPRSAQRFAAVLRDERLRSDLDAGHLYNGACSAALASSDLKGEQAAQWRRQALEWLSEDLRRRRDILTGIEADLTGGVAPEVAARLESLRKSLLAHFEHARVKDPDLASLRGSPEFEAMFAEGTK
jgi:serine/threonine protein kinase/Flp pilus assembly protein TadD